MPPLVSVICLCYNHEKFVEEAINSVLCQTYKNIEIIVVDDLSTDGSRGVIKSICEKNPHIDYIENSINLGNCKSFNLALARAKGIYIIDFATDDVMFHHRIERQVQVFESLPANVGIIYSNAINIDEDGNEKTLHFKEGFQPPTGNVYEKLLEKYIISPPTMMIRNEVLKKLGGYDETLAYEDFDFWIRSSRNYQYYYIDEVLTKRRITGKSHSSKFYEKNNSIMSASTFKVIQKAMWLNKSESEKNALIARVKYELREAFYMHNLEYVEKYYKLLNQLKSVDTRAYIIRLFASSRIPIHPFYKWYLKFKSKLLIIVL